MTAHDHSDHDGHGELQLGHHHVSTPQQFFAVLSALLVLTALTVTASRINFGSANMMIAMAIACIKASLVIAFFMHVKWDTAINKIVFLSSFLFLSLLFIFTLSDALTRRWDSAYHTLRTPVDYGWVQPAPAHEGHH